MNRNRVLRRVAIVALAVVLVGLGGCARWNALMRADEIEREAKAGEARALQRQGDAYFLIGMEYYSLARAAEKAGDTARAKDCATKASLYNTLAKGLAREAEQAARTAPAAANAPAASAQANGPAATPPSPVAPPPVGASLAPRPVAAPAPARAPVAPAPAQRVAPVSTANPPLPDIPPGYRGADAARTRP